MASTEVDEDTTINILEGIDMTTGAAHLKLAATSCVVAAFDRRLMRDEFLNVLAGACSLTWTIERYRTLISLRESMKAGALTPENVEHSIASMAKNVADERKALVELAKRVAACPDTGDTIN